MPAILRLTCTFVILGLLAACSATPTDTGPADLGAFKFGHNVVVADNVRKGAMSRDADIDEMEAVLKAEIDRRLRRYDGDQLYHLGVSVDGYVLAAPGIPVVVSPKSILIIGVSVWDDAAGKKINDKPHQITVYERAGAGVLIGSGYTMSREQQLRELSENAAFEIEKWLAENADWFAPRGTGPAAAPADPAALPGQG